MAEAIAELDEQDAWIDLLYTRFKIEVAQERQPALFRALENYAVTQNDTRLSLYRKASTRQLSHSSWAQIIHLATNHETRFYRNPPVVQLVSELARHFPKPRILSVGCSTGEEPYSLAVELAKQGLPNFNVHGTDVSEPCIEIAQQGLYPAHESISERYAPRMDDGRRMRFGWIKGFVSFEQHNILGERPISFAAPNIIITQNMLIYYRSKTRKRILDHLSCLLADGGYLITAAAEEANWTAEGFERLPGLPATVFRKQP
ncbi:CheR family methyltransferase [Pseudomonas putida]|uniref:Methyltransferase domain-containing protein n=1 Tax=Pseudomonas putida TaxID=303 RepID=A0A7V8EFT1_PSEPU|nr:CheR family methyltransferase [Pseudomonas putida]KAF0254053.1 methyltransferase domain-containing protein [Pseudomonas putida]